MNVIVHGQEASPLTGSMNFPLLKLIVEARNEHGMRQQDWTRYRHYCTTKTRRVRSALRLTHAPNPSGGKQQLRTRRTKRSRRQTREAQSEMDKKRDHTFERRDVALDAVTDTRPLELLLFEAEHCWAAAEELWAKQTDETRAKLRRSSLGRVRRAVQYASKLYELVEALPSIDTYSRAQCLAYVGLVQSASLFIQGNFEATLRMTSATRKLLSLISDCSTSSREEALASSFLDNLDAQIRFAAYSLGGSDDAVNKASDPEACEASLPGFQAMAEALRALNPAASSTVPFELQWRSHTIPVHSLELHDAIQRVQTEEAALAQYVAPIESKPKAQKGTTAKRARLTHAERNAKRRGGVGCMRDASSMHDELDPFDRVLAALTDAESTARILVDDNAQALAKTHSARYEAAGLQLRRAHEWLTYRLLAVRIARNVRLWDDLQARAAKREARAQMLMQERTRRRAHGDQELSKRVGRYHARSGTHTRTVRQQQHRLQRLRDLAALQSDRRRQRLVPGIAKLLDSVDSSLLAMGGLVMVEGEPELSSLLEAKRFYYCSELLLQLAGAFTRHGQYAESLVLLQRASLYVRQATQSLEFSHGADDEDKIFAPHLLGTEHVLTKQAQRLEEQHVQTQACVVRRDTAPSTKMLSTKSGQTLYYHAQRHVSFDPADLELALKQVQTTAPDETVEEMLVDEVNEVSKRAAPIEVEEHVETVEPASSDLHVPPSAPSKPDAPFDPANALEEEEELRREQEQKSRSWLGWWLRR